LAILLTAKTISIIGNNLTVIAVPWFVLDTTGSAAKAGLVSFCSTVPMVLAALFGGPLIDRIGLRRTSVGCDLASAVTTVLVPLLYLSFGLALWQLMILVAVGGLFQTPGDTARGVMLPDAAERAHLSIAQAASAFDASFRGARMIGAPLAGVLIAAIGPAQALFIDAATFAVSAVLIAFFMRTTKADATSEAKPGLGSYFRELREGMVFVRRQGIIFATIFLCMVTNGLDQGWNSVLLPLHTREELGGSAVLGLLVGAMSLGAVLGTVLYGTLGHRFPRFGVLAAAFVLAGPPRYAVAALTDSTVPLLVVMFCGGVASGMLNPILTAVTLEHTPEHLRSRVQGLITAGVLSAMPIGGLLAGFTADGLGTRTALVISGSVYLAATLSILVVPAWRELDKKP
jgi:MFS family permease